MVSGRPIATGRRPPPKRSLLCYKDGNLNSVCIGVNLSSRSMVEVSAFWSWNYLNATFGRLESSIYFKFGLIYVEFGGLLLLVEDHQKVPCFAAKMAT